MALSHGGMERSLEMMKEMVRTGKGPDRDPVEHYLPLVVLTIVGGIIGAVLFLWLLSWLF